MSAGGHHVAAPHLCPQWADDKTCRRRDSLCHGIARVPSFLLSLAALLPVLAAASPAQVHNPDVVKTAFVFNLTKYVEWRHSRPELIIGFAGRGPLGDRLHSSLSGKISESKTIRVVLDPSEEALGTCDILFLGAMPAKARLTWLQKVQNKSVLTVSDEESFAQEGGMVGLVTVGDHVQIEINLEAVQAARLKISSRLLNVAVLVHPAAGVRN
jgi:uncharacterized protein DUF4154